ncbi:hypothetical protein DACRYDRAFT_100473 [Dacryopinax primogenitus]|uniref:Concanavalin A-like lectin/glucanase n=1 Tax=Dacryopinax primogenitus (strain DJM 731) TaxID=1858805 RepID=M5GC99_DACPD|nr:uncharacterized protein DACRYDRAFT_100473 [Dacryopinax primogenitus]EJU01658.1 hypothetical protein DACRYDRAFT_100473 [Dacryopinax primogenitus]
MLTLLKLSALTLVVPAYASSWGLVAPSGNTWIQMVWTQHVPQAPPADVTGGPWYFWCGLEPDGGGVIQPVMAYHGPEGQMTNPNPSFPQVYAMNEQLWSLPWNYGQAGAPAYQESTGIWVAENDQVACSVTWENGIWTQSANVITGQAAGQSITMNTDPNGFFLGENSGFDNTIFAVCETELDGTQAGEWNYPIVFTDLFLRAASSSGVEALCSDPVGNGQLGGVGSIQFEDFSMFDPETCHWSTVTLLPP